MPITAERFARNMHEIGAQVADLYRFIGEHAGEEDGSECRAKAMGVYDATHGRYLLSDFSFFNRIPGASRDRVSKVYVQGYEEGVFAVLLSALM